MMVVPRLVELPGGVWVSPEHVSAVVPRTDRNGDVDGVAAVVWFANRNFTFNGVSAGDIAVAINRGVEKNTIVEVDE